MQFTKEIATKWAEQFADGRGFNNGIEEPKISPDGERGHIVIWRELAKPFRMAAMNNFENVVAMGTGTYTRQIAERPASNSGFVRQRGTMIVWTE